MKKIMEALGKAIEGLLSAKTLWFVVIIAAITCLFLTLYFNGQVPMGMGCPPRVDALGVCADDFQKANQKWIGLIAIISIIMILMGIVAWVWQKLKPKLFPPAGNK